MSKEQLRSLPMPPGPRRRIPILNYFRFRSDTLRALQKMTAEYGDIVFFKLGPQAAFFLNHPDHIRDVLVTRENCFMKGRALQRSKRLLGEGLLTSEDPLHRRQRRLAQPAFHRQRIASYAQIMTAFTERLTPRWQNGQALDISEEMSRLTLAIVGKTLFDADVEGESAEIGEALSSVIGMFNLLLMPFSELLEKLPLKQTRRFEQAKARLDATIYRIIEERRKTGRDHGDLLSMLLMSEDAEAGGEQMTNTQVRDEAMTLFLAGHETTANALTWTWYLLSQHPEVEERLFTEIQQVLGDRPPTVDDVPKLTYTEMVLTESMRLYPPAWAMGRMALVDFPISGYLIPKGSLVLISQYVTHRDARFFSEPDRFIPERWTSKERELRPQYSYFPFGGGTRRCIGEAFAWMEGALLIATIAKRWRLNLVPSHPVTLQPIITLRPKHGMKMTVHAR